MSWNEGLAAVLVFTGVGFFLAGAVGLLRFPDVYTRIHALSKADNLGLGFVVAGLALESGEWRAAVELLVIWLLIMIAGAVSAYLIARAADQEGIDVWRR